MKQLAAAWRRYWFAPAPLLDLAFARIAIVGFQLWFVARPGYGATLRARTALPDSLYDPIPLLHLFVVPAGWTFRPGEGMLEFVLLVTIAAGVLALIGLFTNTALVTFAVGCAFLQSFLYSFGDFHHPEAVIVIALGLLAVSPAGGVLSVDDLRRRLRRAGETRSVPDFDLKGEESEWAGWPLKLIGWVFVLIYASAAYFKLRSAGLDWVNGYTLRYPLVRDALRWDLPLGLWIAEHHYLAQLMSWTSLVFETTFVLVMLFPITRWLYVPLGSAFHLGIYAAMGATFQGYVAAYSVFVPWRDALDRLARRFGRRDKRPVVLYDAGCGLCIRSITWLRYWDWLERLDLRPLADATHDEGGGMATAGLEPEELRRAMHVLLPDGNVESGFFAFRRLLRELPPVWPLLPVFHLPGAGLVGPRIYRWIARRRHRRLCDAADCRMHEPGPPPDAFPPRRAG